MRASYLNAGPNAAEYPEPVGLPTPPSNALLNALENDANTPTGVGSVSGDHHTKCFASRYARLAPLANPPRYESLTNASGLVMRARKLNGRSIGCSRAAGVTGSGNAITRAPRY
jgi:hypothetical protein